MALFTDQLTGKIMLRIVPSTIVLFCLAWLGVPSHAASFDCTKPEAADEIAICNSPALSELDTEMGALWFTYEKIPFMMGASGARADEARAFLEKRGECGDDRACLRTAYESRIETLKRGIENWLSETGMAGSPQWSVDTMPAAVQAITGSYRNMCAELDGALQPGFDRPLVMTADIDGDGMQDFVLDPQDMQCSTAATAFCGNGGCQISLALSRNDYTSPVEILGGGPALTRDDEQGTVLEVWVDNANCENTGPTEACLARYSWQDGKLSTSYEARKSED